MTINEEADEIVSRLKGIRPFKESDNILTVDIWVTPVNPVKFIYVDMIIKKESE